MIVASPAAASIKQQAAIPAGLQQPSNAQGPRLQSPVSHRTSKLIIKGSMLRADAGQTGAAGPTSAGKNFGSLSAIMKPSESRGPKAEEDSALAGRSGDGAPELSPIGQPAPSPAKDASKQEHIIPAADAQASAELVKAQQQSVDASAGVETDARDDGEAAANEAVTRQQAPGDQQPDVIARRQPGSNRRKRSSEPLPLDLSALGYPEITWRFKPVLSRPLRGLSRWKQGIG